MSKRRGSPDQLGMGAQSDLISEVFVPTSSHQAKRIAMARTLLSTGISPEQVASMLSLPLPVFEEAAPKRD